MIRYANAKRLVDRARRLAVVALLLLPAGAATADEGGVVIASGTKGGYYHAVARGLRVVLYSEHGIATDVLATDGSMENLAALDDADSLVNVALVQADALQSYLASHPDFASEYLQVSDAGKECAFIVTSTGSGIDSLAKLAGAGAEGEGEGERSIAVGESGSGAAVTWANMTRLRGDLAGTKAVSQGVIESLLEMRTPRPGGTGPVAAMMVQRPMAVATPLEIVLQNKADYALVPIREGDLEMPGHESGAPVYTHETVVVGFGRDYQASVETICTRALVLAAKDKLSAEELDVVGKAVLTSRRYVMPGSR